MLSCSTVLADVCSFWGGPTAPFPSAGLSRSSASTAPGHPPRAVKITGARNPLVVFNATDQSVALGIQKSRAATWPLSRGLAAVNNDDAAGHKSGRVARHINDQRTQFLRPANPPQRYPLHEHAGKLGVVKDPARSLGVDVAGRQRVDRDVVRSPL